MAPTRHLTHIESELPLALLPAVRRNMPRTARVVAACPHPDGPSRLAGLVVHLCSDVYIWTIDATTCRHIEPDAWLAVPHMLIDTATDDTAKETLHHA